MSVPVMSIGIRSCVNWMRLNFSDIVSATLRTSSVLASPGTPIRSACPRANRQMASRSIVSRWPTMTLGIFGIILTVFAIPGAFLGGKLDDLLGSKRTVQLAIAGVIVATIGIVGVTADRVLFVIPADALAPDRGLFGSAQEKVFMAFALLLGFCMGPMQAASRTLIGRLAPAGMTGEFFGLFALSGRATAWMAPLAIDIVTSTTRSNRWGIACVLGFLLLGFALLSRVREVRESASWP